MTSRSDLNGLAKRVSGDITRSVPQWAEMQKRIPFKQRAKIGSEYEELLSLRRPQGVTFASTTAGTIYALADARAPKTEPARISGAEIIVRDQLAYGAAAAAEKAGPTAYESAVAEILLGIQETHRFYVESMMLYGRSPDGIGRIDTGGVSGAGTTRAWIINEQQWAPGLWTQAENAVLDVFDNSGGTQRNTNAQVVVVSVDVPTRTVNVSGNATDLTAIVAGDMIVFRTTDTQAFYGADAICRNTGTLFNVSASTYGLWKANTSNVGNQPLTLQAAHQAITAAAVRGGLGNMVCLLNTYSWQDLIDDQGALRRFKDSQKAEYVQGAESIKFYGSNGGVLEFVPHPMVKTGDAFGFCIDDWMRGGESDITNRLPGTESADDFFHEIPNYAGFEVRNFSSQFLLCKRPARQVKLYNILPRAFS
jgi:hypothetical protein